MKKILTKIISRCDDCPYCRYNSGYSISYDSGYDCIKTDSRIADDGIIQQYEDKLAEYLESKKTLFPLDKEYVPPNPFTIPKNCPLQDFYDDRRYL